jgi:hypothetical protein
MGGKIGGRSRSPRKLKAVLANLAKANVALAAKRRGRSLSQHFDLNAERSGP